MRPKGVPDTKTDRPTDRRSEHQLISLQYYGRGFESRMEYGCKSMRLLSATLCGWKPYNGPIPHPVCITVRPRLNLRRKGQFVTAEGEK
jgi:hypothetical protein